MKFLKSPWLPLGSAALFAVLAWLFPSERGYLLSLAATGLFWGLLELFSAIFGTGGLDEGEARFDTRNDKQAD